MAYSSSTFTYISRRKDKVTEFKDTKMQYAKSLTLDQKGTAWGKELR